MRRYEYQVRAAEQARAHLEGGHNTLLVMPTGAGKSITAFDVVRDAPAVLWIAHRQELVHQASDMFGAVFGPTNVGVLMAGEHGRPDARIQITTAQTLLRRQDAAERFVSVGKDARVVFDEAHHYEADDWRKLVEVLGAVPRLGLTATPQRNDGRAMGNAYDRLVVGAQYSELLRLGRIVPECVWRPSEYLESNLAADPVETLQRLCPGVPTLAFVHSVAAADELVRRLRRGHGVRGAVIAFDTPRKKRRDAIDKFRRGLVTLLACVDTLTEGVDLPHVRCVVLARPFRFVGAYLQAVGRGLRAHATKPDCVFVDLTGCTHRHGLPTIDREYTLDGLGFIAHAPATRDEGNAERIVPEVLGVDLELATPDRPGALLAKPHVPQINEALPIPDAILAYRKQHGVWPDIT